jgi:hypothetical protein
VTAMRVDVEYRPYLGSIWLNRGHVSYGVNWYGRGPVRKRSILEAKMRQTVRYGAPWLWG